MEIYARVQNNKITEYPVYEQHIKNRGQTNRGYVKCIVANKPIVPRFHYVVEKLELINNVVYVNYELKELTLYQVLRAIHGVTIPGIVKEEVTIANIDKESFDRVIYLVKKEVQNRLDAFAREKQFDDIKSLITYKDSTIPEWASQATIAITKRDQTWSALYTYLDNIINGTVNIPLTEEEIYNVLPSLTWN